MVRVKFRKGKQKEFIKKVLLRIGAPSLRELINRGISVNYSTLKNYSSEQRLLPLELFEDFCELALMEKKDFNFKIVADNFGQVIGGKKSRR